MKIVIIDTEIMGLEEGDWDNLREFGELEVYDYTPPELVVERIGDADIVITDKVVIDDAVMDQCPGIKFIAVLATGYNIVDTEAARRRGIPVANVPKYAGAIVAQSTFAMILELYNKVGLHNESVHRGDWERAKYFCYTVGGIHELAGKTIGIVGFGDIGRRVARVALDFGMNVMVHTRTVTDEMRSMEEQCDRAADGIGSVFGTGTGWIRFVSLEELLSSADIVTLHCPSFPETRGMINADTLSLMKRDSILINTARGDLIDEQALAAALNEERLSGAAVDVLTEEPPRNGSPLIGAKNCIITPHTAWASSEAIYKIRAVNYENVRGFVTGKLQNIVN